MHDDRTRLEQGVKQGSSTWLLLLLLVEPGVLPLASVLRLG